MSLRISVSWLASSREAFKCCSFPRCRYWFGRWQEWPPITDERTTAEALAKELLGIAEFRALQLGTWLGTTNGEVITEAAEMVAPPFFDDRELDRCPIGPPGLRRASSPRHRTGGGLGAPESRGHTPGPQYTAQELQ
jgi:hypothetical protein